MKKHILINYITIALLLLTRVTYGQCSSPGLKIIHEACDTPSNLTITKISCSEVIVGWKGVKKQSYSIKAYSYDEANSIKMLKVKNLNCNDEGLCTATIAVAGLDTLYWGLQASCTEMPGTIYTDEIKGQTVGLPSCPLIEMIDNKQSNNFIVYPNPSSEFVVFDLPRDFKTVDQVCIYNVPGQIVLLINKSKLVHTGSGSYKINLQNIPAGTYFIEVRSVAQSVSSKFTVVKK